METPTTVSRLWLSPHPMAELESEIEGYPFVIRLSSHYYFQGDTDTHWECYAVYFPKVLKSVEMEVPLPVIKAARAQGDQLAEQLQRENPPRSFKKQGDS